MIISLLVLLLVIGVVFWVFQYISGAFGIPPQITVVVNVILVVIVLLYLLEILGVGGIRLPRLV